MFLLKKGAFIDKNCVTHSLDIDKKDNKKIVLHCVKKNQINNFKYLLKSKANHNLKVNKRRISLEKFLKMRYRFSNFKTFFLYRAYTNSNTL